MIEPKPLFDYFKSCPDSKRVGDVCRALGGQSVQLDAQQRRVVMLANSCMNKHMVTARSSRSAGGASW